MLEGFHPQEQSHLPLGGVGVVGREQAEVPALLQYWHVIVRWKWVIASIIAAAMLLGVVVTFLMTAQYTATARLEIAREEQNVTQVKGVDEVQAQQNLEFYQTQYSLLRSRSLAERVVRRLRLASNDGFFESSGAGGLLAAATRARGNADQARERAATDVLLHRISINPIGGSALVDISYKSADPQLSANIVNAWTEQFVQSSIDRRFASTADARAFLEQRLSELRSRLENSERALVNYAQREHIVTLTQSPSSDSKALGQRTLATDTLEALNQELAKATAARIEAQARAEVATRGGTPESITSNTLAQLRDRRAETAAQLAKVLVQFEPGYPQAQELKQQLQVLDASIAREEARIAGARSSDYADALRREQRLQARVSALESQLTSQQRASIQYNIYLREADTNRQLYDALLQRYKEIGVAGVSANNISIVDPAEVPDRPSSPNLILNVLIAFIVGAAIAGLATIALDAVDEGLRDPSQVTRRLGLPFLGSVPDIEKEDEDPITLLGDPKSALTESYLSIRSNLAFSTDHGIPRSMMVASTRPAEGKSTTAAALALVLARTGNRTILIDADMRSPSLHEFFGLQNNQGLSNLLAGQDDWQGLVRTTKIDRLSLITAGPQPPSAAELLSSRRMAELVRKLTETYDHVVIDSAPVLGLADAPLLAGAVEGCVFVAEAEGVSARGIRSAIDRLRSVHAHLYGVVLTKVPQGSYGYGYGYGYGDQFGYGSDGKAAA